MLLKFSKIQWLCLLQMFFVFYTEAQTASISGKITSEKGALPYVTVFLKGTSIGTETDKNGHFKLENITAGKHFLRIQYMGFVSVTDTLHISAGQKIVKNYVLKEEASALDEVVITGTMKESYIQESPIKVEVLTPKFFLTTPTNNIMEALQTVNGVQEQINCGVCGTNDIHINGMEGPYTLVLIDGMPIVSALASVYGFNGIPTSLIKRVEIVKGPASSLYGSEAVGGVINIITVSPENAPKINLNSYYTSHHELNTDIGTSFKIGKANSLLSANYYRNQYRFDFNNDGFTDIPTNNRISVFNKWSFERKNNRVFTLAARYYGEDRFGGQMHWQKKHRGDTIVYGESIYTHRAELLGSYQLPISTENLRLDFSYTLHDQNSYYGSTPYMAQQKIAFANLVWNRKFGKHDILGGATFRQQIYNDNTPATPEADNRVIPGIFVQDEWKPNELNTILFGLRTDYHKEHGIVAAPRIAYKHNFSEYSTLRVNAGRGFRLVNLFTEDHAALTGARTVVVKENLKPEQSWNLNVNYNKVYAALGGSGTIDADVFYTYFSNKIIPDYNTDPDLIIYDNLTGFAEVKGAALAIDQQFRFPLKLKLGVTYQLADEIASDSNGIKTRTPQVFTPNWSGTFLIQYALRRYGISIDYSGKVVGPQPLPVYEAPFAREKNSPWYSIQNVQLSKEWKKQGIQIYGGVKNIFNWTQNSPLINAQNPFGDAFDTAYAWGPLQGRRFFVGVRYGLN